MEGHAIVSVTERSGLRGSRRRQDSGSARDLGAGQAQMAESDGENKQSPTSSARYQWPGTPGYGYAGNTMRVGRVASRQKKYVPLCSVASETA